jgi:hypothetical protein
LTGWEGGAYIRVTNEGGAPLATKKFASVSALDEFQESRVSDLDLAESRKADGRDDAASCGVRSLTTE